MHEKLLKKIDEWHDNRQYKEIVEAILAVPEADRDFILVRRMVSAYNNLREYETALELLQSVQDVGENHPGWHYLRGYSLRYLNREVEAAYHFRKAIELGDHDEDTKEFLALSLEEAAEKQTAEEYYEMRWQNRMLSQGKKPFEDFDFTDFWDDNDYSMEEYVSSPPSNELIAEIQSALGYKLPESYISLMKMHNGGIPKFTCFKTDIPTSWAEDHVAITGIFGIGKDKDSSLCGSVGSEFWIEEWGYPEIGVAICDCPSAGHDMIFLDYSRCGKDGEPVVVHIDQEFDYKITYLADNFESFIRGLCDEELFEEEDSDDEEEHYTVEGYDANKMVDGNQYPAIDENMLLEDMYNDPYFPPFLVDRLKKLLLALGEFIGSGNHTYGEIQEKLDEAVRSINLLEEEFDENDSELETVARESIGESVAYLLAHFAIDIDIEQALRERDW